MIGGIKQSIEKHFSLLNRLNPSALISDALYALNIYDDYKIFYKNLHYGRNGSHSLYNMLYKYKEGKI